MKTDRTELNGLAASNPELANSLRLKFEQWARQANVIPRPPALKRKKKKKLNP